MKLEHLEVIAYTWKMVYDMGVQDVRIAAQAPEELRGLSMDQWAAQWGQRRTLPFMQRRHAEDPRQEASMWQQFGRLYLPAWDRGFIRRVLWKKQPIGGRMGHRVGRALCLLCHKLEDHPHVLKHCRFLAFMFDTVKKAFGLVQRGGGMVDPSHLCWSPRCNPWAWDHKALSCGQD